MYGDRTLSDVSADRVAALAMSILTELARFDRLMRGPASGLSLEATE